MVMSSPALRPRLDEAFEHIEGTILPCLTMVLESLIEASVGMRSRDPHVILAELQTVAAELEELTSAVERSDPRRYDPPILRAANR